MSASAFELTVEDGLAHLRFTRPDAANAMGADFWGRFGPTVRELDAAGAARALVISGEGKHFCAGMDLEAFAGGVLTTESPSEREAFPMIVRDLQDVLSSLEDARFPVIAAVQGACLGGGVDLIAACDLRIAAESAYFRVEETNIGMMADIGSLQRLPKLMPEGVVKELAYLGRTLSAERAAAVGFVNEVRPSAEAALDAALAAAREICGKAPLAVAGTKAAITYARDHSVAEGLAWAQWAQAALWNPSDIQKAIAARVTKQPAEFAPLKPRPRFGG